MQLAGNTFALLLLRVDNVRGALAVGFVDSFQHHIECACKLIGLPVQPGERCAQAAFASLDAVHHLAEVHQGAKGDLQHDEIEDHAHQPANGNENAEEGRSRGNLVESGGEPCPSSCTDKNYQAIGNQYFIEYREGEQGPDQPVAAQCILVICAGVTHMSARLECTLSLFVRLL